MTAWNYFWGKRNNGSSHPLQDHCVDVGVTFATICLDSLLGNQFRRIVGITANESWWTFVQRLAVMALLHDLGKCNVGFQALCFPDAPDTTGHQLEGAVFLLDERVQGRWPQRWFEFMNDAASWFGPGDGTETLFQTLLASLSHHGRPISANDVENSVDARRKYWLPGCLPDGTRLDPMTGIEKLVATARQGFPQAFCKEHLHAPVSPLVQHRFAGLVMLADWIASDERFFPYRAHPHEDRLPLAEEAARRALRDIGLTVPELSRLPAFTEAFGFQPRPLQEHVARLVIDASARVTLLEADTGYGKTEAALYWFWRLYHARKVRALYFALPTRVAARELYFRVRTAVDRVFPNPQQRPSPVLLAVPGYAKADGQDLLPDPAGRLWEDSERTRREETVWAAERPKRFLAAPIAVGTVDQAMLSILATRHAHLRGASLSASLLVIDEVHASDLYMSEIIAELVARHREQGGWTLLLSATLGEAARAKLFQDTPLALPAAAQRPYPSITTCSGEVPVAARGEAKTVSLELLPTLDDQPLVEQLRQALQRGARLLVVCNTVRRAVQLLQRLEASGIDPAWLFAVNGVCCPHHGRFARPDRELLDSAVSARFGKGGDDGPALLIGTQTLEQSLDIDADWLVTDLAPMDVLLQRIGRLHRHPRPRPCGFRHPRVLVRHPSQPLSCFVQQDGVPKGPAGFSRYVYSNGLALETTLQVLQRRGEITIPHDNRTLVEETTHPDALKRLPSTWNKHREWLEGREYMDFRAATNALLDLGTPFGELSFHTDGRAIQTRLGVVEVRVQFTEPLVSCFRARIKEMNLPAYWLADPTLVGEPIAAESLAGAQGFVFSAAGHSFRYTRFGLEKEGT